MTSRLGIAAAITALLVGALTSLGTAAGAAAAAADPMSGAPTVGQCFDMSGSERDAATYSEAAVDCSAPHTSMVIALATMPAGASQDQAGLGPASLQACLPAARRLLGTSNLGIRLTAYSFAYFVPTAERQAAGATWLRCDLTLRNGDGLLPLPDRLRVGSFPFAAAVANCLAGRDLHTTVCATSHTYRATAAMKVRGTRYHSRMEWLAIGRAGCPRGVTTPRDFRFVWPSATAWEGGDRALVCYSHTRR